MKERAGCSTGGSNQAPTEQAPATLNNVAGTSRGGKSFLQRARGKVIRWLRRSLGHQHHHQVSSKPDRLARHARTFINILVGILYVTHHIKFFYKIYYMRDLN
jgi:hypothetical protein